jgi:1-acyl-sn-glycerol-3-phosphate acyltransferase
MLQRATEKQGEPRLQNLFNAFVAWATRTVVRLRYRIEWKGFDRLDKNAGVLFLPNHPAEIDPVIIATKLWPVYHPRPLMNEDFYYMSGIHQLMSSIDALPVPEMSGAASEFKRRRVKHTLDEAINGLKGGDSILLYPAGRLMRDTVENLGATSAVSDIIQQYPDVKICLVRTRGLMGSSFAWYP